MRGSAGLLCVVAGSAFLCVGVSAGEKKPKEDRTYYSVLQISRVDRTIVYEIVETRETTERRKALMKEYQEAVAAWNEEAADFRKDKENRGKKFQKPRPGLPGLYVVKQNIRGKTAAEKLVAELEARHSVVKIKGVDGATTYEAVQSIQVGQRKARMDREYGDALSAWEEEAAAFRKENPGKLFDKARPARPSFIVVRPDLQDKAAADEVVAKLQEGIEKK